MPPETMTHSLRVAAIIALLSSCAQRGITPAKSAALCAQLSALLEEDSALNPQLRRILEKTATEWKLSAYLHSDSLQAFTYPWADSSALH